MSQINDRKRPMNITKLALWFASHYLYIHSSPVAYMIRLERSSNAPPEKTAFNLECC